MKEYEVKKMGRKSVVEGVDLAQVEEWGYHKTSYADMAALLDVGEVTIDEWMSKKGNSFRAAYKRGLARGNEDIRQWQLASARKGNTVMQIWLGKQRIGQRDQPIEEETQEPSQLVIERPPGADDAKQ